MTELQNALKFITMLFFIQKILTFNLGVAFLKSVSIVTDFEKVTLIYTVYIFIRIEKKYFNKVGRYAVLSKRNG